METEVQMFSGFTKQYVEYALGMEITDEMLNDWNASEEAHLCFFREATSEELIEELIKGWYYCGWTNEGKLMQWHKNEHRRLRDLNASIEDQNWHWNEYDRLHKLLMEKARVI